MLDRIDKTFEANFFHIFRLCYRRLRWVGYEPKKRACIIVCLTEILGALAYLRCGKARNDWNAILFDERRYVLLGAGYPLALVYAWDVWHAWRKVTEDPER